MTRRAMFLLGVCVGAAAPLIAKAIRPAWAYALAGGMITYEAACDAAENSMDIISASIESIRKGLKDIRKA